MQCINACDVKNIKHEICKQIVKKMYENGWLCRVVYITQSLTIQHTMMMILFVQKVNVATNFLGNGVIFYSIVQAQTQVTTIAVFSMYGE